MKLVVIAAFVCLVASAHAARFLFDADHGQSAGNADWVIDADSHNLTWTAAGTFTAASGNESNAQRIPTPPASGVVSNTPETYWNGAISAWAVDLIKRGHSVETLPAGTTLTWSTSNAQDLTNYDVVVIDEPNILFSLTEKQALLSFVSNGGRMFMISDHVVSDRNGDGQDSVSVWNDFLTNNLLTNNPFGIVFRSTGTGSNSSGLNTFNHGITGDPILNGPIGVATNEEYFNGNEFQIDNTKNPTVISHIWFGTLGDSNNFCGLASLLYGEGRVVVVGDSSCIDDGTGDPNDTSLFDGYTTDAGGVQHIWILNASEWLAANSADFLVTPTNSLTSIGDPGGPFSPSSQFYTLANTNVTSDLNWRVTKNAAWFDVSATSGVMASGGSTDITVSINTVANSLAQGSYIGSLRFNDEANGSWMSRDVNLTVRVPAALTVSPTLEFNPGGLVGGPFSPSNQIYTLSNTGSGTLGWAANASAAWLSLSLTNGNLAAGANAMVTVSVTAAANSLIGGVYTDTINFANLTNGGGNTNRAVNLSVFNTAGFFDDMESGTNNWSVSSLWHMVGTGACSNWYSPTRSWYFGRDNNCTFDTIDFPTGILKTPPFVVPTNGFLVYFSWEQISDGSDVNNVLITTNDWVTSHQIYSNRTSHSAWHRVVNDLDAFTGKTVRLGFQMITVLESGLGRRGWYVDDVRVDSAGPASLMVMSLSGLNLDGTQGGPFGATSQVYTLINTNVATLSWSASAGDSWLSVSPANGALVADASTNITVSINGSADGLSGGFYSNLVSFVNVTNGRGTTDVLWTLLVRDGISDAWRLQYFGHIDPRADDRSRASDDADGDGQNNMAEFLSGTDPTNSSSVFQTISAIRQGGDITIVWRTFGGMTNVVQATRVGAISNYTNTFTDVSPPVVVLGTGDITTNYVDIGGATNSSARYYRVVLTQMSGAGHDLRGYWSFDEGDGAIAYDSSGNDNTGAVVGAIWTSGMVGSGLYFDGTDQVIISNSASLNPSGAITVAAWVNADGWFGNPRILEKGPSNQYRLLAQSGQLMFDVFGVTNVVTSLPSEGTWHHVAGTYDGSVMAIYVDGQQVAEHLATGPFPNTTNVLTIGNLPGSGNPFNHFSGVIDDVRIYGRALSSAEIMYLYQTGGAGNGAP